MDMWRELERLTAMIAMFQPRLARAIEYGDQIEVSRVRSEMAVTAKRREFVIGRLRGKISEDAGPGWTAT